VQWANGSGFTTSKELEGVPAMPIDAWSNLVATRAGRLLVLSYNATTRVAKLGRPHLTVLFEDGGPLAGNWSMVAQVGRRFHEQRGALALPLPRPAACA
jgi:hypothetical protein